MRRKILNAKPVVKKHLERTANFKWEKILEDPRSHINLEWSFEYIMNIAFYSMLTGQHHLREVEDFSENFDGRVSDTTFHLLLPRIDATPLRKLIADEIKKAIRAHELPKDSFPVRLTVVDGKCASISQKPVGAFSQISDRNGKTQYTNRVLRAAHVSNETKLILGQREIHGKSNEIAEFIPFVKSLLDFYGRTNLLEVISVDAGFISKKNADFLIKNNLNYIMALKSPQKNLVTLGHELLGNRKKCDKKTIEYMNGKKIIRKLYRCQAPEYKNWPHLKQFWRIRQEVIESGKTSIKERYFVTSLEYNELTESQILKAIRLHWVIENNGNWIFDTSWKEDNSPWCNKAFVLVTLLRILTYNIISRLKSRRLRKENDRKRSWESILQMIYILLIESKYEEDNKFFLNACIA